MTIMLCVTFQIESLVTIEILYDKQLARDLNKSSMHERMRRAQHHDQITCIVDYENYRFFFIKTTIGRKTYLHILEDSVYRSRLNLLSNRLAPIWRTFSHSDNLMSTQFNGSYTDKRRPTRNVTRCLHIHAVQ